MKDWKAIIRGLAPSLATALGGPLAGIATKAISDGLLGKGDASDEEIYKSLMSPEGLAKLKDIENAFELKMKELDVDLERIAVDNTKNARQLAKDTSITPQVILSGVFISGFFLLLWMLLASSMELDDSMKMLVSGLIGVVGTNVTLIMKFWFGGSPNDHKHMENMYNSIPGERVKK